MPKRSSCLAITFKSRSPKNDPKREEPEQDGSGWSFNIENPLICVRSNQSGPLPEKSVDCQTARADIELSFSSWIEEDERKEALARAIKHIQNNSRGPACLDCWSYYLSLKPRYSIR